MWHLVPGMVWALSYFIITEIPWSKYLPFFFSFLSSSSLFQGRNKIKEVKQKPEWTFKATLPGKWPHAPFCPSSMPPFGMSSLSWFPPPTPGPSEPWLPVETKTRHVFPGWCRGHCPCCWRCLRTALDIPWREHLGQFGYCDFLWMIRKLLAQKPKTLNCFSEATGRTTMPLTTVHSCS